MSESAVFEEAEVIRLQRWTDEIQRRVSSLEDCAVGLRT